MLKNRLHSDPMGVLILAIEMITEARLDIQRPPDMIVHDLVLIVTIIDPVAVPDIVAADIEVAQETTDVRDPVREITIIPAGDPTLVVDEEEVEAHVDKAEAAGHTTVEDVIDQHLHRYPKRNVIKELYL